MKDGYFSIAKSGIGLLGVFVLISLLLVFSVPALSINSTYDNFSVTLDTVVLNWTNMTINITSYVDNLTVVVDNTTTDIHSNYSQYNRYGVDDYGGLTTNNWDLCFKQTSLNRMSLIVQNQTSDYVNITTLNSTNTTLFYISPYLFCPPGMYYGNFTVYNASNTTDYANITATVVIPISINNTLNETTRSGFFKGGFVQYPDTYHFYYFNTSLGNATGVTIKLNGSYTDDVDIFLFYENGTLISQSVKKGLSDEEMVDIKLPATDSRFEIRVYGNMSSATSTSRYYDGWLFFTTLNVTNTTAPNVTMSSLDFGVLNAGNTNSINFTLENEDSQNLTGVGQSMEIYHVERWTNNSNGYNSSRDFVFFVPSFAQKLKVKIEWNSEAAKNMTNWTLELRNNDGAFINRSQNNYLKANVTGGIREEYILYNGPFSVSNEGFWNISVINNSTGSLNLYNVTAYIWMNETEWLNVTLANGSAFSDMVFNSTGQENSSYNMTANLTVPANNVLNGSYEGFLQYNNTGGWKLRLPVSFSVRAGILSINNVFNRSAYSLKDNIRLNHTRTISIPFNNTGGWPIYYTSTNSSALYLNGNASSPYYINFTASLPSNPINDSSLNGSNGTITINFTLNTSLTGNNEGSYRGWIFFNTTNSTSSSQSYPYQTFNLSLEVNLSGDLIVNITRIIPANSVNVTVNSSIVSLNITAALMNGTVVSRSNLNMTNFNFTSTNITNLNVTDYFKDLTSSLNDSGEHGGSLCVNDGGGGFCLINVTIPNGTVGGTYNISIPVRYNTSEGFLYGVGINSTFVVNDTGLNVSRLTALTRTVNEGDSWIFNVSVTNYGPETATGNIIMNELTDPKTAATVSRYGIETGCGSAPGGQVYYTMSISENQVCYYSWVITTSDVDSNTSATFNVVANGTAFNSNITGITLTINNVPSTGNPPGGPPGPSSPSVTYDRSVSITSHDSVFYLKLGESNTSTITVKNTGNTSSTIKLNVSVYGSEGNITTAVTPASRVVGEGNSSSFNVTIDISNITALGNYTGIFKAFVDGYETNYDTKSFTVVVLATEEKQIEINLSYENYTVVFNNLTNTFEQIKAAGGCRVFFNSTTNMTYIECAHLSMENVTFVENLINSTNNTINEIKSAIAEGDYAKAQLLLGTLNEKFERIRNGIEDLINEQHKRNAEAWGGTWIWVMIAIVVIVAGGLLVYMLLPPEGYTTGYGYRPQGESSFSRIKDKIKNLFSGLSGKLKRKKSGSAGGAETPQGTETAAPETAKKYKGGYEKSSKFDYTFKSGGLNRIKLEKIAKKLKKKK